MLSQEELRSLAAVEGGTRVSLCLPTHRSGDRTAQGAIRLRNLIASAEEQAREDGRGDAARDAVAPARALVDDRTFWNHQADGLALFADEDGMREHRLPARMEELAFVGERFCVRPLLPVVSSGRRFHVLALSRNRVRLVEATAESAREVDLGDIPRSLREAVGYDYESRSLQFHTGTSPFAGLERRSAMFHGQGRSSDADKAELERFLRQVDDGVRAILRDPDAPLVVAAVGYVAAMYRGFSKHPGLVEDAVEGSPEAESATALRRAALPLVAPILEAERRRAVAAVAEAAGSGELVTSVGDALALLVQGRVATLLVRDSGPLWGRLAGGAAVTHDERHPGDDDLLDLAVHRGLATGAEVCAASDEELPGGAPLAALARF